MTLETRSLELPGLSDYLRLLTRQLQYFTIESDCLLWTAYKPICPFCASLGLNSDKEIKGRLMCRNLTALWHSQAPTNTEPSMTCGRVNRATKESTGGWNATPVAFQLAGWRVLGMHIILTSPIWSAIFPHTIHLHNNTVAIFHPGNHKYELKLWPAATGVNNSQSLLYHMH